MPLPAAEFREQFSTLSRDEAEAFVADLWSARGWEVEPADDWLVARRSASGPTERLAVLTAGDDVPPNDVDVVVDAMDSSGVGVPDGVDVIGPFELYQMARFAVDRDDSERLLATHFDYEPPGRDAEGGSSTTAGDDPVASPGSDSGGSVTFGGAVHTPAEGPSPTYHESGGGPVVEATDDGTDGPSPDEARHAGGGRPSRRRILIAAGALLTGIGTVAATGWPFDSEPTVEPRGLTEDGVVDPDALARAHAAAIDARSYSLGLLQVVRHADSSLRSYLSMDLAIAVDRTFLTHVSTDGPEAPLFLGDPPASAVFWSNGDVHLVRHSPTETESFHEFHPPDGVVGSWRYWAKMVPFGGTYGSSPERYYHTVFDAIPVRLVERRRSGGTTRYRVADDGSELATSSTLGEPDVSDVRDVRLDAVVDQRSIVESFELRFAAEMDGRAVELYRTLDYTAIGETVVERPTRED